MQSYDYYTQLATKGCGDSRARHLDLSTGPQQGRQREANGHGGGTRLCAHVLMSSDEGAGDRDGPGHAGVKILRAADSFAAATT